MTVADESLTLTSATVGTVTTYTAAGAGGGYEVVIGNDTANPVSVTLETEELALLAAGGVDTNSVAAVNAALDTVITNGVKVWEAAILGLTPTVAGLEAFKIDSITIGADGKVTVTLPAGVSPKTGRGVDITLKLKGASDLAGPWTDIESANGTTFAPVTPASGETKKFYKVVVEFAASQN